MTPVRYFLVAHKLEWINTQISILWTFVMLLSHIITYRIVHGLRFYSVQLTCKCAVVMLFQRLDSPCWRLIARSWQARDASCCRCRSRSRFDIYAGHEFQHRVAAQAGNAPEPEPDVNASHYLNAFMHAIVMSIHLHCFGNWSTIWARCECITLTQCVYA